MSNQQMLCFSNDCQELIKIFLTFNSIKFEYFVAAWQKMNFQYIFHGNERHHEINQLVENGLLVVKHEFIKAKLQNVRIGFFYLLYTLYFKQPVDEFCKLRFLVNEWKELHNFYESFDLIDRESDQIRLIFWKLIQADAFRFVESDQEYGFEYFMQNRNLNKTDKYQLFEARSNNVACQVESELKNFQNEKTGILSAIGILQVGYNEMKEHLDKTGPATGILPDTMVLEEIMSGIKQIENHFQIQTLKPNTNEISAGGSELTNNSEQGTSSTLATAIARSTCSTSITTTTKTPETPNRKIKKLRKTKSKLEIGQRRNKLKFKGFTVQNSNGPDSNHSSNSDSDSDDNRNTKSKSLFRKREHSKRNIIPTWTLSEYDNHFLITPPNWVQKNRSSDMGRLRRTVNRVLEATEELDEELENSQRTCNTKNISTTNATDISTTSADIDNQKNSKKRKSSSTVTSLPSI